ncbi:epoxide hydrolase [Moniliophthora roreri]|nr:epoxide hydrolase [Moniliophthora roreri]
MRCLCWFTCNLDLKSQISLNTNWMTSQLLYAWGKDTVGARTALGIANGHRNTAHNTNATYPVPRLLLTMRDVIMAASSDLLPCPVRLWTISLFYTDPAEYKSSLIIKGILNILDAEKAIFTGHNWYVLQVAFIRSQIHLFTVIYQAPSADLNWDVVNKMTKEKVGYELFGYWGFFAEEGADKIIKDNFEKFMNFVYPENAKQWSSDLIPLGTHKHISCRERKTIRGAAFVDACRGIPAQNVLTSIPTFFGALENYVAPAALAIFATQELCSNSTVKELQANHWVQLRKVGVIESLRVWLEGVVSMR